jgi:hypothetical protein
MSEVKQGAEPQELSIRPTKFEYIFSTDPGDPEKTISKVRVWWVKVGTLSTSETSEMVNRLMGRPAKDGKDAIMPAPEWAAIEPYYEAWLKQEEPPSTGTPLAAWPGCTKALIEALKPYRVKTVEDFANLVDHEVSKIRIPGIRGIWQNAKNFLTARDNFSEVAAEMEKKDTEISGLRGEMSDLRDQIEKLVQAGIVQKKKKG